MSNIVFKGTHMHYDLNTFTEFLKEINLEDYKNRFSQVKIVEMDLPKNIQALDLIYEQLNYFSFVLNFHVQIIISPQIVLF